MPIRDFEVNTRVRETLLLTDLSLKPFRTKPGSYLEVELRDKTGAIKGRLFDGGEEAFTRLTKETAVEVAGRVQEYSGELQLILEAIAKAEGGYSLEDFLPVLENYAEVKKEFLKKLEEIRLYISPEMNALLELVFEKDFLARFCRAPAALKYHHPYLGGLMEHTLNVVKNAYALAQNYPRADLGLTLTGALLHDIGKVEEFSSGSAVIKYSLEGELLGHIVLGNLLLKEAIRRLRAEGTYFSNELENLLLHIITSHHREEEWGSPRPPMILEAMLVHFADIADAEAFKFLSCTGEEGACVWSPLLKRKVYLKNRDGEVPF